MRNSREAFDSPCLQWLLAVSLAALSLQLHFWNRPNAPASELLLNAGDGNADMTLRNDGFPETHIGTIHVDLTSPHHSVRLNWSGPEAAAQQVGPFHSSPGGGRGTNDCDDCAESNRGGSYCTPRGTRLVEGFSDHMASAQGAKFVSWFHTSREIALHSASHIPDYPASIGCVRLNEHAAQLIHNNSIAGKTQVIVGGTWTPPPPLGH